MNENTEAQKPKGITKRLVRFAAVASFVVALMPLIIGAKFYFQDNGFLNSGSEFNSEMVEGMRKMIRNVAFGIIPALSGLLTGQCDFTVGLFQKN